METDEETDEGNKKMLIDEFVDLRVRAGEMERLEREREHARRVGERENRLRSLTAHRRRRERRGATAWTEAAPAPAVPTTAATAPAGDAPAVVAEPERELAHAAR